VRKSNSKRPPKLVIATYLAGIVKIKNRKEGKKTFENKSKQYDLSLQACIAMPCSVEQNEN